VCRTILLSVVLAVVAVGVAQPQTCRVRVAGGQVVSEGLKPIDTLSWDDTFQLTTVGGVECFAADRQNSWLRMRLDPAWPQDATGPATIGIRYLDNKAAGGGGPVVMQYDSSDPTRMVGGAWAWTPPVWRQGSGKWVTNYRTIEKPGFRGRELGADFGITGMTNRRWDTLYVAEVTVTRAGVLLSADVRGLALGDQQPAKIAAEVIAPDGSPAPDGTEVRFDAILGRCDPPQTVTEDGAATTSFIPAGQEGEAIIQATTDFSAGELRLPLVQGTGGVTEIEWTVADFEAENAGEVTRAYMAGGVTGSVEVTAEAAHAGTMGAAITYAREPDPDWFNAGVELEPQIPGALLGLSFWAKTTEPNVELRWAIMDAGDEHWNYYAPVLETGADGWRRYGSSTVDSYFPNRDAVLDYPLTFHSVYVTRQPWSKAEKGTLFVEDIVARLLVANSEADRLRRPAP